MTREEKIQVVEKIIDKEYDNFFETIGRDGSITWERYVATKIVDSIKLEELDKDDVFDEVNEVIDDFGLSEIVSSAICNRFGRRKLDREELERIILIWIRYGTWTDEDIAAGSAFDIINHIEGEK